VFAEEIFLWKFEGPPGKSELFLQILRNKLEMFFLLENWRDGLSLNLLEIL